MVFLFIAVSYQLSAVSFFSVTKVPVVRKNLGKK